MATALHRLGSWSARHPWRLIGAWVVLLALLAGLATAFARPGDDGLSMPGTESQQALDLLNEKFPAAGGASARIAVKAPTGHTLAEPAIQAELRGALAQVAKTPQVLAADPTVTKLSDDKRIGFADVHYSVPVDEASEHAKEGLTDAIDPLREAGLQVEYSGGVIITESPEGLNEAIGLLIGFLILAITFGSLVSAGLPLVMALVGVAVSLLGLQVASGLIEFSTAAPTLAMMLGLALGIDYTLFIVSRHRAQVRAGMPLMESIATATATAGSAVVFAGLTVVIALIALTVVGIPFMTAMGLAAAATVAVTALLAVTLVPAVLSLLGARLEKGLLPFINQAHDTEVECGADPSTYRPMGERWARLVTRRPWLTLGAAILACGVVALPALDLELGLPDDGTKAANTTERRAYDLLTEGFGAGFNGPLLMVVHTPNNTDAARLAAEAEHRLETSHGIAAVSSPFPNATGDVALLSVTPTTGPGSIETKELVKRIRDGVAAHHDPSGATAYVTGQTAVNIDISDKLSHALPEFLALIVGLALVLMTIVFRSILVPIKAVAGFLLSIAASLGAVVWVFQQGHLAGLFGLGATGPVVSMLPILLVGILFGLAMDYEVFLVSRIRESYIEIGDPQRAITDGMRHSARVVTAAGLIMISVFGSFIFGVNPVVKAMGLALAFGVLIDAFVVRMTLVPAVLSLLGKAAWWLPKWLDRLLPDVDIEGSRLAEPPAGHAELSQIHA